MYQLMARPLPATQDHAFTQTAATPKRIGFRVEGNGPAVVLLHSSMGSKSQWRLLMESMRDAHRVIAIDLHGYGDSPMPQHSDHHSLLDEVRLVQSTLAQVLAPGEGFHLVGHSFGGGVALRLAHAHPERIRSLTLYEPTAFHLLERHDPALEAVRAVAHVTQVGLREGQHSSATEAFIDFWSGKGAYAALPPARQALFASLLPKVPLDFQALLDDPLRPADYGRMSIPTCLIAGRDSPACAHAIVATLAATLAQVEMHVIAAGHMAPVSHPAVVNPIIESFIHGADALQGPNTPER